MSVTQTLPRFVLVHGAWHGGWCWQGVARRLKEAGHAVTAPTCRGLGINGEPEGVTLVDCVDSVVRHVEDLPDGQVILVGHSWGGYVVAGAAPRLADRLDRVVFWSAFVPDAGRSLYDEAPPEHQEFYASVRESGDAAIALPRETFVRRFMPEASREAAEMVHSLLHPQPVATFTDPAVSGDAYRSLGVPMSYVLSEDDIALPPGEYGWRRFADRIDVQPISVPGGHESMFTYPKELAEALLTTQRDAR